MKAILSLVVLFSVILLSFAFSQQIMAAEGHDLILEWGSFGIGQPSLFSHPQSIAIDESSNIYVTDYGNKRIQKFDSNGEFLAEWGKSGTGTSEFHYPLGIATDDEYVFVSDNSLHRIQKFDLNGKFIAEWGTKGKNPGQFFYPNGIAIGKNGTVYVADTGNQRIQKFTSDGDYILEFGKSGTQAGKFLTITSIETDSEGNIYVSDRGNYKIEQYDSDGNFLKSMPFSANGYVFRPQGIAVDAQNKIYVVNSDNNRILHLDPDDGLILTFFERLGPLPNQFTVPLDMAVDKNGFLFVIDAGEHKILKFKTPLSVHSQKSISTNDETVTVVDTASPELILPEDVTVDATGIETMVSIGQAISIDLIDPSPTVTNDSPKVFTVGQTLVTWTAIDSFGNSVSKIQTIEVQACGKSISYYNMIEGTPDDDTIVGTNLPDLIFSLGGDDIIDGKKGNDCIFGGEGDDIIFGNEGNDDLTGDEGNDIIKGQIGNDIITGGTGIDVIDGGDDIDTCNDPQNSDGDLVVNCEL